MSPVAQSWSRVDLPAILASLAHDVARVSRFVREVFERDGHRCTFVDGGFRCIETKNLVAHHVKAWDHDCDPDHGRTLCARHNSLVERRRREM